MANTSGSVEQPSTIESSVNANPAATDAVPGLPPVVQIKRKHVERLCANQEKIRSFFGVQLESVSDEGSSATAAPLVSSGGGVVVNYKVNHVRREDKVDSNQESLVELAKRVQHYLDTVCVTEAEDSSYDSDCEIDDANHEQVSRTASDTLGQEFAEYVSSCGGTSPAIPAPSQPHQSNDQLALSGYKCALVASASSGQVPKPPTCAQFPNVCSLTGTIPTSGPTYTSRLEFALKLGYTERLVQAALHRLGPNPTQNELLAELIKLGAQQLPCSTGTNKLNCDYICDGAQTECPALGAISCSQQEDGSSVGGTEDGATSATGTCPSDMLRAIVIDGSNVAMSHGNKQSFSCRGIKLCVDWFRNRGHKEIVVFVPKWRKESCSLDNPIKDQEILNELERDGIMVFTPSRFVGGKRMICYDDRYILKLAVENDGIVVSNDNYRDLAQENSEFKKVVEDRILMYSFACDRFMPPDDPLGRSGPTLDNFLRVQPKRGDLPPLCPYGKKCTYGTKCKFNHPERGTGPHKSISERLSEHAQWHMSAARMEQQARTPLQGKSLSVPLNAASGDQCMGMSSGGESLRKALCRTRSNVVTADSANHYQQQQQQQQQQQYSPSYLHCGPQQLQPPPPQCNRLPAWPPSGDPLQGFPKSHSVENLPLENAPAFSIPSSPSQQQLGSAATPSPFGQQRPMWPPGTGRSSTSVSPSNLHPPPPPDDMGDGVNLHRKLQRQLTLNPSGCDPRIYQMQRGICGMPPRGTQGGGASGGGGSGGGVQGNPQPHSPHRPLEPSRSSHCGQANPWDMHHGHHGQHPNVTRIASAPDSSRPWHGGPPPASSSEPQINLWPPQHPVHMPSQQQQQQLLQEQRRRRLHYHLASIFPEEQVQTVMQIYPDETDPQKICAAILNMFKKI